MKKNRPAVMLSVLCDYSKVEVLSDIIFENLTTIGIRKYTVERDIMDREFMNFKSSLGNCNIKVCRRKGKVYCYPEFEDVKKLCDENNIGFKECMDIIKKEIK